MNNLAKSQLFAIGIPVLLVVMVYFIWKNTKPSANVAQTTPSNGNGNGTATDEQGGV